MLNQKKIVLVLCLFLSIFSFLGMSKLTFTNDFRVFFSKDNPRLVELEEFENNFTKQEDILIVIETKIGGIFEIEILEIIKSLTIDAWQTPHSIRVNSIANYQYVNKSDDGINISNALPLEKPISSLDIKLLKEKVIDDENDFKPIISSRHDVSIIEIQLSLPEGDIFASEESVNYVRSLIDKYNNSNFRIYLAGYATSNVSLGEAALLDMKKLVPITYFLMIIGLFIWLRSSVLVISVIVLVTATVIVSIGLTGWVSPQLTPILGYVPSVIMIIAVADSIHILISYRQNLNSELTIVDAIEKAVLDNKLPIFITSITTIIGFLALNFNDSPPYRQLGNIVAIGIAVALFFSVYILPIIIKRFDKAKYRSKVLGQDILDYIEIVVFKNSKLILFSGLVVLTFSVFFAFQNKFTDHWYNYFGHSFEIRQTIEVLNDKHTGVDILEYQLKAKDGFDIFDPEYLEDVDNLRQWLETQTNVVNISNFANVIKKLNTRLSISDDSYLIPSTRQEISQFFLLYELSLPFGLGVDNIVDINRKSTRFKVFLKKTDAKDILTLNENIKSWMSKNITSIVISDATGLDVVMSDLNVKNINKMLQSTLFALVLIGICLFFVLRSGYLGIIATIINIAPAMLTYATCYFLWGEIDLASSLVICMSLGIIVDDTVHLLYKYKLKFEETNDHRKAVQHAFSTAGLAIFITTLILMTGFIVQGFSDFQPTSKVGLLMSITFMYALIIDILILPCLLKFNSKNNLRYIKNVEISK